MIGSGLKTAMVAAATAVAVMASGTAGYAAPAAHIDSLRNGKDIQLYLPGQKLLVDVDESKIFPDFKANVSLTGLKQELTSFGNSIHERLGWDPAAMAPAGREVHNALDIADQAIRFHGNNGTAVASWVPKEETVLNGLVNGPSPCRGRCLGESTWSVSRYLTTAALGPAGRRGHRPLRPLLGHQHQPFPLAPRG
jgi:hypothetical protein